MNPMFWILVIIGCVLLWFLLVFLFKPIGKVFYRLWKDAMDTMMDESEERKERE